jgi:hypothetical protein
MLTASEVLQTAREALADILKTPKARIYASRKGIVAGTTQIEAYRAYVFRRIDGRVRFEVWSKAHKRHIPTTVYTLTPDLERRAGEMLDSL